MTMQTVVHTRNLWYFHVGSLDAVLMRIPAVALYEVRLVAKGNPVEMLP